jgi:hypothetical protein
VQFGRRTEASAQARLLRPDWELGQRKLLDVLQLAAQKLNTRSASSAPSFSVDSRLAHNPCMLRGGSPRERTFTNQTLAHVLTKDDEHLANLIAAGEARASPSCFVSSHVDQ